MIIQDEHILKAESTMIGDNNSIIKDDEINDLSITKPNTTETIIKRNDDLYKSPNKRKQIKPNRLTNDDEVIPTDLTNGHASPLPPASIPSDDPEQYSPSKQQEAYCNLCERSFCNKYFLKTHFAKKHGGISLVSPSSTSLELNNNNQISSPSSPSLSNEQPLPLIVNQKISEDYCEICQKRFCNKYYLRKHKGECHGVYTDYIKSLQKSANESPVKNNTSRPIQQVPSNNSNMLLINPFYLPQTTDIKPMFSATNNGMTTTTTTTTTLSSSSSSSSPPPLNILPKIDPTKISPQRPIRRCNICQQEFRNKALLRMHMNTIHANETNKKNLTNKPNIKPPSTPTIPMSPSSNLGFLQPYVDTASPLAHKLVAGQATQASYGILHDSYFCAKMADRVVCEICNKQVCNKYFLKTHKAKVHGIINGTNNTLNGNIDNLPPTMVPTNNLHTMISGDEMKSPKLENQQDEQIENDTEQASSESNENNESNIEQQSDTYCSICKKDFSTKYLFFFHMQTTHNDTSDPTYKTLIQFMKAATSMNENSLQNPFLSLATTLGNHSVNNVEQKQPESEDESDGNVEQLKRKRSSSQTSNDSNKRMNSLTEPNGGLQPFLLESEDPKFAHTFVPCMVYLPVIRRVTKQVKINLRLKPVLADVSS